MVLTETIETIEWTPAGVVMIDQTRLPRETAFVTCRTYVEVAEAIRSMIIRGAPAIGVAAAMGVAIGALHSENLDADMPVICETLAKTRPTAVNLFWAIDRMQKLYTSMRHEPLPVIRQRLIAEAQKVRQDDIAINRAIGQHGAPFGTGWQNSSYSLQRRSTGYSRIRHRARRNSCRCRNGQED